MNTPFLGLTVLLMNSYPVLWLSDFIYRFITYEIMTTYSSNIMKSQIGLYTIRLIFALIVSIFIVQLFFKKSNFSQRVNNTNLSTFFIFAGIFIIYALKYPFINVPIPSTVQNEPIYIILFNIHMLGELFLYIGVFILFLNLSPTHESSTQPSYTQAKYFPAIVAIGTVLLLMHSSYITGVSGILNYALLNDLHLLKSYKWLTPFLLSLMVMVILTFNTKFFSRLQVTSTIQIYFIGIVLSLITIFSHRYGFSPVLLKQHVQLFEEILLVVGSVGILLTLSPINGDKKIRIKE